MVLQVDAACELEVEARSRSSTSVGSIGPSSRTARLPRGQDTQRSGLEASLDLNLRHEALYRHTITNVA